MILFRRTSGPVLEEVCGISWPPRSGGIEQRDHADALSKTFNLAGLGCAFAIVPEPSCGNA